jgi:hypothetical protein
MEEPDLGHFSSPAPEAGIETRVTFYGGVTAEIGEGSRGGQRVSGKRRWRPNNLQAPTPQQPATSLRTSASGARPKLEQGDVDADAEWEAELRRLWRYWMEEGAGKTRATTRLLRMAQVADRALRRLRACAGGALSGAAGLEMLAALREASAAEFRPCPVGRLLTWAEAAQREWARGCGSRELWGRCGRVAGSWACRRTGRARRWHSASRIGVRVGPGSACMSTWARWLCPSVCPPPPHTHTQ